MMPNTRSTLGEDIETRHFKPPEEHVAATAGLYAQTVQAHWPLARPVEPRSVIGPLAGYVGKYGDAVRQLARRSHGPAGINANPAAARAGTQAAMAMRVLVVEDDAIIGTLLAEMLTGMGHDVCGIEATEADAVSAAARCKPDMMIVDISLGEGSGIAAIDAIYLTGPVPHVFVSGDICGIRALRPGSIFIRKPYREADLARVMQEALDAASIQ
jgi:CheY-like chemotaxis protein